MSFGKSTQTVTPEMTQEQRDMLAAQTGLFTGTLAPTYQNTIANATNLYNQSAGGLLTAAQNQAGVANQAQQALGGTGESALRTGISGLESLFNPDYERNQINAALMPAQAQYEQNIANQRSLFGGTGNLGSAREALAGQQLAGQNMATQAQIAAQVANDIANRRAQVGTNLAQLGQGGIGQAMGAAGQQVTAAMSPQALYNQYASVLFGTPAASYSPNFAGTIGSTTTNTGFGLGGGKGLFSGMGL